MGNGDVNSGSKYVRMAEKSLYVIVEFGLVAMAILISFQGLKDFYQLDFSKDIAIQMALVLNDFLFVIILIELLSTVISHLSEGGFQLQPFLIIGIISSVRRILVLGAQLPSLSVSKESFNRGLSELSIEALVVFVLAVALILVRKSEPKSG